jgi:hypothetical protein
MAIRRFTRLTNAFSKRIENHIHAIAIQGDVPRNVENGGAALLALSR